MGSYVGRLLCSILAADCDGLLQTNPIQPIMNGLRYKVIVVLSPWAPQNA